jgi:UDP-N-acetylmuramate dehydrogenase
LVIPEAIEEAARLLGDAARRDVPIGPMTTYRVGGCASLYVEVADERAIAAVCAAISATGIAALVVGKGSNLLISDAGFGGIALHLGESYAAVAAEGERVEAGAAAAYPVVARRSVASGLAGMEWAVGIPGSVGGAVAMNAGGHGAETRDRLEWAAVVDLSSPDPEPRRLAAPDLGLSYRHSLIEANHLVLAAAFRLEAGDAGEGAARISEIVRWRRENQPGGQNAGSIFTNPPGDSAGRIIEAAGLKGLRIGSAAVSEKHANFIQADAGGAADDVRRVIEAVQASVLERTGVRLETEVRFIAG